MRVPRENSLAKRLGLPTVPLTGTAINLRCRDGYGPLPSLPSILIREAETVRDGKKTAVNRQMTAGRHEVRKLDSKSHNLRILSKYTDEEP